MAKPKSPFVVFSEKASQKVAKKAKKKTSKRWEPDPGLRILGEAVAKHKKIEMPDFKLRKATDVTAAKKVLKQAGLTGKKHPESRRGSKD